MKRTFGFRKVAKGLVSVAVGFTVMGIPLQAVVAQDASTNVAEDTLSEENIITDYLEDYEDIDFERKVEFNPNLYTGVTRIKQEGIKGQDKVLYRIEVLEQTGEEISRHFEERETIKPPQDEITEVGTRIKHGTSRIANIDMEEGTEVIKVHGVDGDHTKPAIDEVIEFGVRKTVTETDEEIINYDIERRVNPDLAVGETRIIQQGETGVSTTYYTAIYISGQLTTRTPQRTEVTKRPVTHIVEYGARAEEVVTQFEDIDFETIRVEAPDLDEGQEQVIEGIKGQVKITVKNTIVNGALQGVEEISRETISEPQDRIIRYGTRKSRSTTETEVWSFQTIERETDKLPRGERKVEVQGVDGYIERTYKEVVVGGKVTEKVLVSENRVQPTDQVILIGTGEKAVETSSSESVSSESAKPAESSSESVTVEKSSETVQVTPTNTGKSGQRLPNTGEVTGVVGTISTLVLATAGYLFKPRKKD